MAAERLDQIRTPVSLNEEQWGIFKSLHSGIRSPEDPVTWRTLVVDLRRLLGVEAPDCNVPPREKFEDAYDLVCGLTEGTRLEPLIPEILLAVGEFEDLIEQTQQGLDTLLFNGRHYPEPLLSKLAEEFLKKGRSVAVVNPVGHYSDGETRILTPHISRSVDHLILMASTQVRQGGSLEVLSKVLWSVRNPETVKVAEVDVVVPMLGGSRGHRLGQDKRIGYEVMEAEANPKILALTASHILSQLRQRTGREGPRIRFVTVDVHNEEYPRKVFEEAGFDFLSVDPAPEFSEETYKELEKRDCLRLPLKVVACDRGSVPRTEKMARALLTHPNNTLKSLDVVVIDKTRLAAGVVADARIAEIERLRLETDGTISQEDVPVSTATDLSSEPCAVVVSDDMFDSGGTAVRDMELLHTYYSSISLKIFSATHPVFSKGIQALDGVGADVYLFGNTLKQPELYDRPDVRIVDMAPAIARAILGE